MIKERILSVKKAGLNFHFMIGLVLWEVVKKMEKYIEVNVKRMMDKVLSIVKLFHYQIGETHNFALKGLM